LSETLTLAPDTTEISVNDQEAEPWGTELMNFVSANQHVIVRCPWMGGAEVTLGEAMTTYSYPPNMTEGDLPTVTEAVYELMANRVLEEEESDEEEESPAEHETSKGEEIEEPKAERAKTEKPKPKAENLAKPVKSEGKEAKPPERSQPAKIAAAERPVPASPAKNETVQPAAAKAETAADSLKNPAETPRTASASNPEAAVSHGTRSETATQQSAGSEVAAAPAEIPAAGYVHTPELVSAPQAEIDRRIQAAEAAILEPAPDVRRLEPMAEDATEVFGLPEPAATGSEPELQETPEPQAPGVLEDLVDFSVENEIALADPETVIFGCEEEGLIDLAEQEEISIERQDAALPGYDESFTVLEIDDAPRQPDSETELREEAEKDTPERFVPTSPRAAEAGSALMQIVERIRTSQPQAAEAAGETLDKIAELAGRLEQQSGEEVITEDEAQQKLEELFTELFDQLGIEHQPELIQSLVRLTLQRRSSGQPQNLGAEEEAGETPQDDGTHEAIKKLLPGSGPNSKMMEAAPTIGKSALQLYVYDFPRELKKRLAA
jgi:hypothetical protein